MVQSLLASVGASLHVTMKALEFSGGIMTTSRLAPVGAGLHKMPKALGFIFRKDDT